MAKFRRRASVAVCIGCGCDDNHACEGGCYWLRVDYIAGVGVCSECSGHLARWLAGERGPHMSECLPGVAAFFRKRT
jgi:hypothetical protein